MNITLSVEVNNDDLIANLLFLNDTKETFYLDSWTSGMHKILTNEVFEITDENNNPVEYGGLMGKRIIVADDFVSLEPGKSINTKVILNKDYELVKGVSYNVKYLGYQPYCPDIQESKELHSNTVEITY